MTHYAGANVFVSPGATIAAGVLLEAAVNSRLTIEPGACVGSGAIIQAVGGELVLEAGALIGQGVLVLGCGVVGRSACIGANCTLINPAIVPSQLLPPRSWVKGAEVQGGLRPSQPSGELTPNGSRPDQQQASPSSDQGSEDPHESTSSVTDEVSAPDNDAAADSANSSGTPGTAPVYGRSQVTQLVNTLFPHRNAPLSNAEEG